MKRSLFIIIGIVLVILLLGIWLYVLFFGSVSNTPDTFSDLDFDDTTDTSVSFDSADIGLEPIIDVAGPERLQQLTIKPTVGHQEIFSNNSPSSKIFYIEAGTGHIFSIDTSSGEEERVSATTIPLTVKGVITPNGKFVLLKSDSNSGTIFTIGILSTSTDELNTTILDEKIIDFTTTKNNTFLYSVQSSDSVVGKEYNPVSKKSLVLFTIPFREAVIEWGENANDTHYAYPKASNKLGGFGYQIIDGTLSRLPIAGLGLSLIGNDEYIVYGKQEGNDYRNGLFNQNTKEFLPFLINTIPEKCAFNTFSTTTIICGGSLLDIDINMPDVWYQGVTDFTDSIWEIEPITQTTIVLANPLLDIGRQIDVVNILIGREGVVYFTNKNDQTLWRLDVSISDTGA